jgi:3-hydroxybutyryl-CoA dehydrogenase
VKKNARQIGIVGTGMIASSMAVLCTGHGFDTVVISRSRESTQKCLDSYDSSFRQLVAQGLTSKQQAEICRSYLTISTDYSAMEKAECVFECIKEDISDKRAVYKLIEENCAAIKAICSVSSSIVPDVLSEGMEKYGDRIIVTHPFNPAHMVPYFELCAASKTASGVTEYAMELLSELDRKPVLLKKPTPGFIGNRLQFALWREAMELVESGIADPRDVDACLNYSFCLRYTSIGIFEHFDSGGLELCSTVSGNLFPILSDKKTVSPILSSRVAEGKLGQKTGEGFYDWSGVDMEKYKERVNEPFLKFCKWKFPEE